VRDHIFPAISPFKASEQFGPGFLLFSFFSQKSSLEFEDCFLLAVVALQFLLFFFFSFTHNTLFSLLREIVTTKTGFFFYGVFSFNPPSLRLNPLLPFWPASNKFVPALLESQKRRAAQIMADNEWSSNPASPTPSLLPSLLWNDPTFFFLISPPLEVTSPCSSLSVSSLSKDSFFLVYRQR